ncbi:MAG: PQQ-binding-like beta-propeller repeat protein, partial [Pseudomonadota bacterium]|nr:PQQ-binding-like beta-propeller repeat protein [Pseudomonadota bacterium]
MKLFTQYTLLRLSYAAALLLATTSLHPTPVDAAEAGNVNDQRIIDAQRNEPGSWLTYGQTYKEQRFSELTQINRSNIAELNLAWSKPIGDYNMRMQGTPLVVDGVMYVSNGWSVIYALNATNGE